MLTAVQNIWYLDNNAKGTHCFVSTATLNSCMWLTATCGSAVKRECIVAFPRQQWLHKRATTLRYTCIACAVRSFTQSFESYAENLLSSSSSTLYTLIIVTRTKKNMNLIKTAFLGAFAKLRKAAIRFVISVSLFAWNRSAPIGRICMKFDIRVFFFENRSRTLKFY